MYRKINTSHSNSASGISVRVHTDGKRLKGQGLSPYLNSSGKNSKHRVFRMVQVASPSLLKLMVKTLVILPLAIVGLASFCAAALLMCLYSVSVLSRAHKVTTPPQNPVI